MTTPSWKNRVVATGLAAPSSLLPHPRNWRKHPLKQQRTMADAFGQLGWLVPVIVNRRSGRLIDGHLRVRMAQSAGLAEVPVTYVDLTEEEELLALATIDPLGDLARRGADDLRSIVGDLEVQTGDLEQAIKDLDRLAAGDQEGTAQSRGRRANQRGKAWERAVAAQIGGERVGQLGGKDDVQHPRFAIQTKVGKAFPERFWSWLCAIPTLPGQRRALIVGDAPGPGRRRRAVVVLELQEWEVAEGLTPQNREGDTDANL